MGSVMFLPMEFGVFAFFEIIDEILKGDGPPASSLSKNIAFGARMV